MAILASCDNCGATAPMAETRDWFKVSTTGIFAVPPGRGQTVEPGRQHACSTECGRALLEARKRVS